MTTTAAGSLARRERTSTTGRSPAGLACALGAAVLVSGSVMTQAYQASSDVPTHALSYPWSPSVSLVTSFLWGTAQLGLVAGAMAFRRSGVAGTGRLARASALALVLGTMGIVLGHVLSVPARAQTWDDGGAQIAGAAFAIGTVLTVAGFLLTGVTTVRARRWTGARARLPAAAAVASAPLLALQSTSWLPAAVGLYSLSFLALGLALDWPSASVPAEA